MNRAFIRVTRVLLTIMAAVPLAARQSRLPVGGNRGVFSIALPEGWKETRRITPDALPPTLEFKRAGSPRGSLQITVMWSPKKDPDFGKPDSIHAMLELMSKQYLKNAVEKKLTLVPLKGDAVSGYYFAATDRDNEPSADQYPVVTTGVLGVKNLELIFTILSDKKDDAAVTEALAALRGSSIEPDGKTAAELEADDPQAIAVREGKGAFSVTVPLSQVALSLPKAGHSWQRGNPGLGGGTANPRYFYFEDKQSTAALSGWFESSENYSDLKKFWKGELKGLKKSGLGEPQTITFETISGWEVVLYDLPLREAPRPGAAQANMRAERNQAGTWIDLHLSVTSEESSDKKRELLHTLLKSLVVEEKP